MGYFFRLGYNTSRFSLGKNIKLKNDLTLPTPVAALIFAAFAVVPYVPPHILLKHQNIATCFDRRTTPQYFILLYHYIVVAIELHSISECKNDRVSTNLNTKNTIKQKEIKFEYFSVFL